MPIRIFFNKINFPIKKILVIRFDHIGDIIASTVVLEPLREKFPDAEIDFMVPYWVSDILRENPFIDNLIKFDSPWFSRKKQGLIAHLKVLAGMARLIRHGRYNIAIDLRGDARHITAMFMGRAKYRIGYGISGMGFLLNKQVPYKELTHETDRSMELLEPLGVGDGDAKVQLYLSNEDKNNAEDLKIRYDIRTPYIIIHPVPGHVSKEWNKVGFAEVARYANKKGLCSVFIGAQSDKDTIKDIAKAYDSEVIDLSGKTTLGVLGGIIKEAEMFVGVDSGPAHMAAALGVPTVILFSGANNPDEWAPRGNNVDIIYPGEKNSLSDISPDEVYKKIERALNR